jgi:hypothetical protein
VPRVENLYDPWDMPAQSASSLQTAVVVDRGRGGDSSSSSNKVIQAQPSQLSSGMRRVRQDFRPAPAATNGQRELNGFLHLLPGDLVKLLYEGCNEDDIEWSYGSLAESPATRGWFLKAALESVQPDPAA